MEAEIRPGILPVTGPRRSRVHRAVRAKIDLRKEPWVIFSCGLLIYGALGWLGAYVAEIYNADGLARIAQAHGVLFSRDPHLGALGFVWPPLPALTNIPLVALLKPVQALLFAGPLMSAFYSALALAVLSSILVKFGVGRGWRLIWIIAFGMHKLILHDATMGLSESGFLAFLLLSLNGYVGWEKEGKVSGLIMAGFGAALAIYCRYEGLAWVGALTLAIIWRLTLKGFRPWSKVVEGTLLAFAVPIAWAMPVWMAVNWQLMGHPLYFLIGAGATSNTPDTARAMGPAHPLFFAYGSLAGSASLLLEKVVTFAPLLVAASAVLFISILVRRRWSDLAYLLLAWSVLGFTFIIAYQGILPPFARYFFWAVPGSIIVTAAIYQSCRSAWLRHFVGVAAAGLAIYTAIILPLDAWSKMPEDIEHRTLGSVLVSPEAASYADLTVPIDEFRAIGDFLNSQTPGTLTLVDASVSSPLVFFLNRPSDLVITTDRDFFPILRAPSGNVDQMLVPYPSFDTLGRSQVLNYHPSLWENGAPWATFVRKFPGQMQWRLYKVENRG